MGYDLELLHDLLEELSHSGFPVNLHPPNRTLTGTFMTEETDYDVAQPQDEPRITLHLSQSEDFEVSFRSDEIYNEQQRDVSSAHGISTENLRRNTERGAIAKSNQTQIERGCGPDEAHTTAEIECEDASNMSESAETVDQEQACLETTQKINQSTKSEDFSTERRSNKESAEPAEADGEEEMRPGAESKLTRPGKLLHKFYTLNLRHHPFVACSIIHGINLCLYSIAILYIIYFIVS